MIPYNRDKTIRGLLEKVVKIKEDKIGVSADNDLVLREAALDELVFSAGRYAWYVFQGDNPVTYTNKSGYRTLTLKKGDEFGIRPANSAPGIWRMISQVNGETIVFSLTELEKNSLVGRSESRG
jgi:hypothetical protein